MAVNAYNNNSGQFNLLVRDQSALQCFITSVNPGRRVAFKISEGTARYGAVYLTESEPPVPLAVTEGCR